MIIYQILQGVETMTELESRAKAPRLGRRKMKREDVKSRILTYGTFETPRLTTGVSKELRRKSMNERKNALKIGY